MMMELWKIRPPRVVEETTVVLLPSKTWRLILAIFFAVPFVVGLPISFTANLRPVLDPALNGLVAIVAGVPLVYLIWLMVIKKPRLILTAEGLLLVRPILRNRFWRWDQLQGFSLESYVMNLRGQYVHHFAVTRTVEANERVILRLSPTYLYRNKVKVQHILDVLNAYCDRYGTGSARREEEISSGEG